MSKTVLSNLQKHIPQSAASEFLYGLVMSRVGNLVSVGSGWHIYCHASRQTEVLCYWLGVERSKVCR